MSEGRRRSLLVPLDGSLPAEEALEAAGAIADVRGDDLDVLFVSPEPLSEDEIAERTNVAGEWRSRVRLLGATGDPADAIGRVGEDLGADAILMASHGTTSDMKALAGHVTLDVLANPPCPVFVIRSALNMRSQTKRLRYLRRILLPFEGTYGALEAVRQAADLAFGANARLVMLHVMTDASAASPLTPVFSDFAPHDFEAWREEFIRSSLALTGTPARVEVEALLRTGDPAEEIVKFAADWDCDLIVSTWGGNLSEGKGRVVQALLQQSPCPLLFLLSRKNSDEC